MIFSLLTGSLYALAALFALSSLKKRRSKLALGIAGAALFFALNTAAPVLLPTDWAAHSLGEILFHAVQGVSNPTTLEELGLVAGGRLALLLGLGYLGFFALKNGKDWNKGMARLPQIQKISLGIFAGAALLALIFETLFQASETTTTGLYFISAAGALIWSGHRMTGEK